MEDQNKEKEKKDYQYIYFITSHMKSKNIELFLDNNNKNINHLEKVSVLKLNTTKNII